jgi:hypothetical protein
MKTEVFVTGSRVFAPIKQKPNNPVGKWFIDGTVPAKCFRTTGGHIVLRNRKGEQRHIWEDAEDFLNDVSLTINDHQLNPAVEIT